MINRRFLNYKQYESFLHDLNDGQILQDAIVFIQDESHPCIWTHGKEYLCNAGKSSLTEGLTEGTLVFDDGFGNSAFTIAINNGNITITDSKGYSFTTQFLLKSEYHTDDVLSKYSVNPIQNKTVAEALANKQDNLVAGNGIKIVNNTISSTLDVEPYVILSQPEFPPQNPSSNKIYIVVQPAGDGTYKYIQYIYRDGQWIATKDMSPEFDLSGYATLKDIDDVQDIVDLLYQKKGDYASKDYVARAIEYVQGVIDRKYVLKKDVYRPTDMDDWSTEAATPLDITSSDNEGSGNGAYAHIFLEQSQYDMMHSHDNNTIYFIYEESDDQPSGQNWKFGDSFPIILT